MVLVWWLVLVAGCGWWFGVCVGVGVVGVGGRYCGVLGDGGDVSVGDVASGWP